MKIKTGHLRPGETATASITGAHFADLMRVAPDCHDLLNIKEIVVHPLSRSHETNALFGISLSHYDAQGNHVAFESANRAVVLNTDNTEDVYHAVDAPYQSSAKSTTLAVGTKAAFADEAPADRLSYKLAARWNSADGQRMTPASVNRGVSTATMNGVTKYLVRRSDASGDSAVHRMLELRGNATSDTGDALLCEGRYSDANRKYVDYNGQQATVMTESDFKSISETLKTQLDTSSSFAHDMEVAVNLNDGEPPDMVHAHFTVHRDPLLPNFPATAHHFAAAVSGEQGAAAAPISRNAADAALTAAIFSEMSLEDATTAVFQPIEA